VDKRREQLGPLDRLSDISIFSGHNIYQPSAGFHSTFIIHHPVLTECFVTNEQNSVYGLQSRARICKRLRSPGRNRSRPGRKSIPRFFNKFTNTGSEISSRRESKKNRSAAVCTVDLHFVVDTQQSINYPIVRDTIQKVS
jgi:hypothetical protein